MVRAPDLQSGMWQFDPAQLYKILNSKKGRVSNVFTCLYSPALWGSLRGNIMNYLKNIKTKSAS